MVVGSVNFYIRVILSRTTKAHLEELLLNLSQMMVEL